MGRIASFLAIAALASGCTSLLGEFAVGSGDAGVDAASLDGAPALDAAGDATAPDAAGTDAGGGDAGNDTGGGGDAAGDTGVDAFVPCTAPKTQCPNVCTDLTSDGHNCGACGHDCQGGGCASSHCQPTPLLQNEQGLNNLVVDGANVYWTTYTSSGGTLKTMPLKGAPGPTVLGSFPSVANEVALDDPKQPQSVFCMATDTAYTTWTIYRASPTQVQSAAPIQNGNGAHGQGLAADPGHVYGGANTSSGTTALVGYSLVGGPNVTVFSGSGRVTRIVTDQQYVIWTDQQDNRVMSVPKQGGNPTTISGPGTAGNLADLTLAPPTVVWSNYGASIWNALESGVSPASVATVSQATDVSGIATDGMLVYYTDAPNGLVLSVPLGGGAPTPIAKNAIKPTRIGVNPGYIVWYESGNANLMKIVR